MLLTSISKNSLLLALFAALTTAAIAGTYLLTKEKIATQERIAANQALIDIFPTNTHDNSLLDDTIQTEDSQHLALNKAANIHIARKQQQVVGFIFPLIALNAYADNIRLLVGININGEISGVRVIQHKETPGLGDAIELRKSTWILGFNNKHIENPDPKRWTVKKDNGEFDQFTGATITPRAVTKAVFKSLLFFHENKETLLKEAQKKTTQTKTNSDTKQLSRN